MNRARVLEKTSSSPHRLPRVHSHWNVLPSKLGCHLRTIHGKRAHSSYSLSFQPLNGARFHGDVAGGVGRLGVRGEPVSPVASRALLVASVTQALSPRFISFCLSAPLSLELITRAKGQGQEYAPLHLRFLPTMLLFT